MVITSLMILTVLVADVTYSSRVRLLKASHERDAEAAKWLAISGANMYQLILIVDKQLGKQLQQMAAGTGYESLLSSIGGLWEMLPGINTGLLRMMFVSGTSADSDDLAAFEADGLTEAQREESREGSGLWANKHFLDFEGDFIAEVIDENSKVSLNLIKNASGTTTCQENIGAQLLYGLMSGEENDQWFHDRNVERWDLICNVLDWVDTDTTASGPQGGYEDNLYNRLESPYLTKNAFFDTAEELRLVDGWNDDVYDRFAKHLTIYADKINVNTAPDEVLKGLLRAYTIGTKPTDSALDQYLQNVRSDPLFMAYSSAKDFVDRFKDQGLNLDSKLESVLDIDSSVFTVTSTGFVNDSARVLKVVFDFSKSTQGKIRYWRME
jgi:type II secretory pathway component PulK